VLFVELPVLLSVAMEALDVVTVEVVLIPLVIAVVVMATFVVDVDVFDALTLKKKTWREISL
jgi:hypothetical protein